MPPVLFPVLSLTMAAEEADSSVQRVVVVVVKRRLPVDP
jgi:hypothetical protein